VSPDDNVYESAAAILAALVAGYAERSVDLPENRGVVYGEVIWDCEQLVVSGVDVFPGQPGAPQDLFTSPAGVEVPRSATLTVELVRCVHHLQEDTPPSMQQQDEDARVLLKDLLLVPYIIFKRYRAKTLGLPTGCALVGIGRAVVVGPQAQYAAVRMQCQVGV
jgi:hypothetical protein